ncbi:MAG: hypothetical protein GC171_10530 [Terrimonas sp.]|nr:hypothetical protein [Terrimonas sp.]
MKKILAGVVLEFLFTVAHAQQDWQRFVLDDRVSVLVPGIPEKVELEQVEMYNLTISDSTNYSTSIVDFNDFGLDATMLQSMVATDEFEEQFKTGFMMQMEGSTLRSSTRGRFQNFTTYLFEIDFADKESGGESKLSSYSIFVGSKVYTLNYTAKVPRPEDKEKFFSSLIIL